MATRVLDKAPFRLSAVNGRICATGNDGVLRALSRIEGSSIFESPYGPYISFGGSRENIMAAEAMAAPAFVAPEYNDLRRTLMAPDLGDLRMWRAIAPALSRPMMPHQEEFCAFAWPQRGVINGSEQGTGKTTTGIVLATAWAAKVTVVVVPKSLVSQWEVEWSTVVYDMSETAIIPLVGLSIADRLDVLSSMMQIAPHIVVIVNYDVISKLKVRLVQIAKDHRMTLILDESWRMKSESSACCKALITIADMCDHVICQTGTPVAQGIRDLWSQVRVVEGPSARMETLKEWIDWYEQMVWVKKNGRMQQVPRGCKDPVMLMRRLAKIFYRAQKASCLRLPPKLPVRRVQLDMPPDMRAVYKEIEKHGESALGDGSSLAGERSTTLRLQQVVGGFVFNPDGSYTEDEAGQTHDLRLRLIHSPKAEWLLQYAEDELLHDPSHRVIVWFKFNAELLHMHRRLSKLYDEESHRIGIAVDDMPVDDDIESFNSRDIDGIQIYLCQYKKMAYGKNMQGGDTHIYFSHTWSHVEKSQSADRSHRIGRNDPVEYIELVMRNSIDGVILHATDNLQDMQDRYAPDTTGGM